MKTVAETPLAQLKAPLTMPQVPLEDLSVKPDPEAVAVYVAQVPVVNQVPALIRHPSWAPLKMALRNPDPEKDPVPVGPEPGADVVGVAAPDFGRYLMPDDGQLDDDPVTVVAEKSALVRGPLVKKP